MNRMDSLYKTTKDMLEVLTENYTTVDERTTVISKINNLLEKRSVILKEITPPYSEKEESIGKEIIKMDRTIREKMDHIYKLIQTDLRKLKQKKDTNKTYINPYKDMKTVDGMYLDNKL